MVFQFIMRKIFVINNVIYMFNLVCRSAMDTLVGPGGWVDNCMSIGRLGMFELVIRAYPDWRLDVQGTLPNDLQHRGVRPYCVYFLPQCKQYIRFRSLLCNIFIMLFISVIALV